MLPDLMVVAQKPNIYAVEIDEMSAREQSLGPCSPEFTFSGF